jgi:ABC-type phosphate transport system substrate-binding protein
MNSHTRRTTVIAVIVAVLAALVAGGGVWLAQRGGGSPPAATGVTAVPTPTTSPTTPQPQTMTVRAAGSTSCWSPACRRCLPTRSEALWTCVKITVGPPGWACRTGCAARRTGTAGGLRRLAEPVAPGKAHRAQPGRTAR